MFFPGKTFPSTSPGRLFPGRLVRATPPRDSELSRKSPNCLPRLSGNSLRHAWSSLDHFDGSLPTPLSRKGGYPLKASLRRSADRPNLSDLGWSSHWEAHAKLSGPSVRPVPSNISIIEHIYVFTHVNSTILRKCISQELSHNEALAHLLLPPGNTQISPHYIKSTL